MNNLTLRQLRAFRAAAELESFTLAAQRLHVTPAALSGLIKELETQLGVTLFDRSTRKVSLSAVGGEFFPLTERVLQDLEVAVASITNLKEKRRGIVRLAAPEVISCTLVPVVMAAFRERHPQVEVRFLDVPIDEVIARTARGDIDVGLAPGPIEHPEVDHVPVMSAALWLAVRGDDVLARRAKVSWEELGHHTFISFFRDFAHWGQAQFGPNLDSSYPRNMLVVERVNTAFAMVQAGFGVTACPVYARALAQGFGLSLVKLTRPEIHREYALLHRVGHSRPPAVEAFCDFMLEFAPTWALGLAGAKDSRRHARHAHR